MSNLGDVAVFKSDEEVLKHWFEERDKEKKDETIDTKLGSTITAKDVGKIIKAKIVAITDEDVFTDVGYKSEGIIPRSEFRNPEELEVGKEVEVYLEGLEDSDGTVSVSKLKANFIKLWDDIEKYYQEGKVLPAKILKRIKGGMLVDLLGVDAFLPGSQIDIRAVANMDEWVGKDIEVKIVKINKPRRNIVVSRRAILEEQRKHLREKLLEELEVGQVREGVVKNITDYGVFIDLNGADGLLHITDISWGRINHPSEMFKIGDTIKVKILGFDEKKERISLGLKQLEDHPWNYIDEKYKVGDVVKGKVVAITDYGAFVEIEKGIEGLIHVSEMSWDQSITHPSKILSEGDIVEAKILSIDKNEQKISLGIKQLGEDPWQNIEEKFPIGSKTEGVICNLTSFGAFVELDGGVDGLIHISDISWTKKISHPSEVFNKGDKIEVVILGIDKEKRRISLGYKQLTKDPWEEIDSKVKVDSKVKGKITKILAKGLILELPDELEVMIPAKEISDKSIKLNEYFEPNEEIEFVISEVDKENRKIIGSLKRAFSDSKALNEYLESKKK